MPKRKEKVSQYTDPETKEVRERVEIKLDASEVPEKGSSFAALSGPASAGTIVRIGDTRATIIRQVDVREVIATARAFYDVMVRKVPVGMTIYWFEVDFHNTDGVLRDAPTKKKTN